MTSGKAQRVNHILDPFNSIRVKTTETTSPIKTLVATTTMKREIVLINKSRTFHDLKKLSNDLEKVMNLQMIYTMGDIKVTNINKFALNKSFGAFIIYKLRIYLFSSYIRKI